MKSINIEKILLTTGIDGMVIPFYKLKNGIVEFEMKIVSEKLDEVAKDENVESGVEDSEPEEK